MCVCVCECVRACVVVWCGVVPVRVCGERGRLRAGVRWPDGDAVDSNFFRRNALRFLIIRTLAIFFCRACFVSRKYTCPSQRHQRGDL